MLKSLAFGFLVSAVLYGQPATLGQLRLVDMSARTPASVVSVSGSGSPNPTLTVAPGSFTPASGDCVYVYQPMTIAQWAVASHGDLGRGYFCLLVIDSTHWQITSEMYTGSTSTTGNGVAAGDRILPLTVYYLRQGPRVGLDGPVNRGTWNSATAYRALDRVTAPDGNTYVAIADSTNQQPPSVLYWRQVDPTKLGPGTFTASVENTSGKASASNYSLTYDKYLLDTYISGSGWDWYPSGGPHNDVVAWYWLASHDNSYLPQAQELGTRVEDEANGTVQCDWTSPTGYCGRGTDLDYARLSAGQMAMGESAIHFTLSLAQQQTYANKVLNDLSTAHNGVDTSDCVDMGRSQGAFSSADQITCSNYVCTGTGFLSKTGLGPGSVIIAIPYNGDHLEAVGRVKTVDSDTQMTMERSLVFSRLNDAKGPAVLGYNTGLTEGDAQGSNTPWYYTPPWDDSKHYCGIKAWLNHHPSSPSMIPGEEGHYSADYFNSVGNSDFSFLNNRTISALVPWIAWGLETADVDLRGVTLAEESLNYYMTQWMAQNVKSRWAGTGGHGNQYGPGRVYYGAAAIATMVQNSLTVTPPGYVTGNYLTNLAKAMHYGWWNTYPVYQETYDSGYGSLFNGDTDGGMELFTIAPQLMLTANLFPNDDSSKWTWDYLKNRRGDYGIFKGAGGWTSINFFPWPLWQYDPVAASKSITDASTPLQFGGYQTDMQECMNSGLFCIPDSASSVLYSTTGWGSNDTQVQVQSQPNFVTGGDYEQWGMAGDLMIQQDNGQYSNTMLGGNGLNAITALAPNGAMYDGSAPMIWNSTSLDQVWGATGAKMMWAQTDRWAGGTSGGPSDNSYMYARINFNPTVRQDSTAGYVPTVQSWFKVAGAVTREVEHRKAGSGKPNYVIVYDVFKNVAAGNQLRDYWHLIDMPDASTKFKAERHPEYVSTDFANRAVTLTQPNVGRLNVKSLVVPGSANSNVAMLEENFVPPPFSGQAYQDAYELFAYDKPTAATNANPVVFTVDTTANIRPKVNFTGGTGNWKAINGAWTATIIDGTHFSIPVDSTNFGALSGSILFPTYAHPPTWSAGVGTFYASGDAFGAYAFPTDGSVSLSTENFVSDGPGNFNGTWPITGSSYNGSYTTITVSMASDPGAFEYGGNVSYPAWCTYSSPLVPTPSCHGNYQRPHTATYAASYWPGTFRVTGCASSDGINCDNEQNGELLTVLQPSTDTSATMPPLAQPTCTGVGGNCLTLEIQDPIYPQVAIMARNGDRPTQVTTTTKHTGQADYVVSGLASGTYGVSVNGSHLATFTTTDADTTGKFSTTAGTIQVVQSGAAASASLVASPTALAFTISSAGTPSPAQSTTISESGQTMANYTFVPDGFTPWASVTPSTGSGPATVSVSVSPFGLTPGNTYSGTLQLSTTDANVGNSPLTIPITVTYYSAPSISTTSPLPSTTVGASYSQSLTATGGVPPYTWTPVSNTCSGLTLASNGTFSGTPTTAQTCALNAKVTDSQSPGATITKTFSLTVAAAGGGPITMNLAPNPISLTCSANQTVTFTCSNGACAWSASNGTSNVSLSAASGSDAANFTVSANCNGLTASQILSDTVTVSSPNASNSPVQLPVTITVNGPSVDTTTMPDASWASSYSQGLSVSGGAGPYTWTASGLPAGVAIGADGTISGLPMVAGTFNVQVTATDTNGVSSRPRSLPLNVAFPLPAVLIGGSARASGTGH